MIRIRVTISALLIISSTPAFSQGGVVSAPILEAQVSTLNTTQATQTSIMSSMNGVITALEKADNAYRDALTKTTWLRNMATAQRLLHMIENLVCTSKNLNARLAAADNSCLYNFRYDMMLIKVQMSADYMGIILSGVSMTSGERMRTLNDVIAAFEESQEMMVRLNNALDADLMRLRLANSSARTIKNMYSYERRRR